MGREWCTQQGLSTEMAVEGSGHGAVRLGYALLSYGFLLTKDSINNTPTIILPRRRHVRGSINPWQRRSKHVLSRRKRWKISRLDLSCCRVISRKRRGALIVPKTDYLPKLNSSPIIIVGHSFNEWKRFKTFWCILPRKGPNRRLGRSTCFTVVHIDWLHCISCRKSLVSL